MENKEKKEWGTILAIFLIALVVLLFAYFFIFNEITKKENISKNKNNAEIINNQKNTLDDSEIDIEKLEKQLDELDVNVDDIFEQLD